MSENDVVKIVCFPEKMMQTGDRYEVEIRGCSIWATEVSKKSPNSYEHNFPMYEKKIKFRSKLACFIFFFFAVGCRENKRINQKRLVIERYRDEFYPYRSLSMGLQTRPCRGNAG